MIKVQVDANGIKVLQQSMANVTTNLSRELGAIAKETAKKAKNKIAGQITEKVVVKKGAVKKNIIVKMRDVHTAEVIVGGGKRIGLKYFTPRQTAKGVSYKIDKGGSRKMVRGAFMGPKPGMLAPKLNGQVFIRAGYQEPIKRSKGEKSKGHREGPVQRTKTGKEKLIKLYGPSMLAVFLKNNMMERAIFNIRRDLRFELRDRIRYNRLKQSGAI